MWSSRRNPQPLDDNGPIMIERSVTRKVLEQAKAETSGVK